MAENGKKLICIGTSTGGPRALENLLPRFPKTLNVPILIVQHMPPTFTKSLANRLDRLAALRVKEAEDGEDIRSDTAYIAPGNFHMTVRRNRTGLSIQLDQNAPYKGHRPSVNNLFQSVSHIQDYQIIAVVLTGMGTDGTAGLKVLKSMKNDVTAIAESEKTCIVFGMPRSAIQANVIDEIAPIDRMADTILKHLNCGG